MTRLSRRSVLGAVAVASLARPNILRADTTAVKIGLLSDVTGTYQDNGGLGAKVAAEMAVADFGGSLLGRPVQVIQADNLNKPDVASALARRWLDTEGVSLLLDGASSPAALAIQQVSREKKRVYCTTSSLATALVGKSCSPYFFQFNSNAWALAKGVCGTLTDKGYNTWYFVSVDNEAGISLQSGAEHFIQPSGGKILGSARAPVGDLDFSSHLISAQASGAKVICFANAGTDLQNCIKQAEEFGVTRTGALLATLVLEVNDVISIGQDVCKGLVMATSFYWNQSPDTNAWSHRYMPKMGKPPSSGQACAYSATAHWLKAVQATGTLDGDAVAAKMRETPVSDFFNKDVHIMPNGTVPHTMYVWLVQPSSEAKEKWNVFKAFATLPSPTAFPSPNAFGCPLVKV